MGPLKCTECSMPHSSCFSRPSGHCPRSHPAPSRGQNSWCPRRALLSLSGEPTGEIKLVLMEHGFPVRSQPSSDHLPPRSISGELGQASTAAAGALSPVTSWALLLALLHSSLHLPASSSLLGLMVPTPRPLCITLPLPEGSSSARAYPPSPDAPTATCLPNLYFSARAPEVT